MKIYHQCTVKYKKIDSHTGKEKGTTELHLFDANSFTDAEASVTEKMKEITKKEFNIKDIKKINIVDVVDKYEGNFWYKCKNIREDIDAGGKSKYITEIGYVQADNIRDAWDRMSDYLVSEGLVSTIHTVTQTKVTEIYK